MMMTMMAMMMMMIMMMMDQHHPSHRVTRTTLSYIRTPASRVEFPFIQR